MIQLKHNFCIDKEVQLKVQKACENLYGNQPEFVKDFQLNTKANSEAIQEVLSKHNCTSLVWCGTGGSYLSAKVIYEVVNNKKIYFFENLDAIKIQRSLDELDVTKTLFVFASKSGRTADVLILKKLLENKIPDLPKRSLVLTQSQQSPLLDWAKANQVSTLSLPEDICGRFSCFTNIGLLALNYLDKNEQQNWIQGAEWALNQKTLVQQLCEFYVQSLKEEKWISVFWVYSSIFNSWGHWIQQLWAESLAKNTKASQRVSTPLSALGSLDQHSLLQQFSDGFSDKSYSFLTFNYPNTSDQNLNVDGLGVSFSDILKVQGESTYEALGDQPKLILEVDYKNLSSLSALFMLYQLVVIVLADILSVYPYDQPGVEESKVIARKKLGF